MYNSIESALDYNHKAAKEVDAVKTRIVNREIESSLDPIFGLFETLHLSGPLGLVFMSAIGAAVFIYQNKDIDLAGSVLSIPKLFALAQALLLAGGVRAMHNSAGLIAKSRAAVRTGTGPLASEVAQGCCSDLGHRTLKAIEQSTEATQRLITKLERQEYKELSSGSLPSPVFA